MKSIMSPIIGHRGIAGIAPENTLSSIAIAHQNHIPWIELDVTLLADQQPVLFHDASLERTTGQTGYINHINFQTMQKLDAGKWVSSQFLDEPIPTLSQALAFIKEKNMGLNLELKPNLCNPHLLGKIVAQELEKIAFPNNKLVISSFNYQALMTYYNYQTLNKKKKKIGCLFEKLDANWQAYAKKLDAVAIHLNANYIKIEYINEVLNAGYELYCYTVNDEVQAKKLIKQGVTGCFSDIPHKIKLI